MQDKARDRAQEILVREEAFLQCPEAKSINVSHAFGPVFAIEADYGAGEFERFFLTMESKRMELVDPEEQADRPV